MFGAISMCSLMLLLVVVVLLAWRSRGRTASKRLALSRARWLARCFAWFRCRACICTMQSCSAHNCPQYPAVPRSTLVLPAVPAVPCNNKQYTAVPCSTPHYPAVPHSTLQYPATPCSTQAHRYRAPCSTPLHPIPFSTVRHLATTPQGALQSFAGVHRSPCSGLQNRAVPCSTPQHFALPCNIPSQSLQYPTIPCRTLQCLTVPCIIMQSSVAS